MSLGTVTDMVRGFSTFCDVVACMHAAKGLSEARRQNDVDAQFLYTAQTIDRLICLGFSFAEVGCIMGGTDPGTLSTLKHVELVPRVANLFFTPAVEVMKMRSSNFDLKSGLKFFERGVVAPIFDVVRTGAQSVKYDCLNDLKRLDADPNATRDVFISDGDDGGHWIKVPINRAEAEQSIRISTIVEDSAAIVSAGTRLGVIEHSVSGAVNGSVAIYERLAYFFGFQGQAPVQVAVPTAAAPLAVPVPPVAASAPNIATLDDLVDPDTRLLREIPIRLHDDIVFSQYICPITQNPIRDPVRDSTNNLTLYERAAITRVLGVHPISPLTRQPMTVASLIEEDAIKAIIDRRLRVHQQGLRDYLARAQQN